MKSYDYRIEVMNHENKMLYDIQYTGQRRDIGNLVIEQFGKSKEIASLHVYQPIFHGGMAPVTDNHSVNVTEVGERLDEQFFRLYDGAVSNERNERFYCSQRDLNAYFRDERQDEDNFMNVNDAPEIEVMKFPADDTPSPPRQKNLSHEEVVELVRKQREEREAMEAAETEKEEPAHFTLGDVTIHLDGQEPIHFDTCSYDPSQGGIHILPPSEPTDIQFFGEPFGYTHSKSKSLTAAYSELKHTVGDYETDAQTHFARLLLDIVKKKTLNYEEALEFLSDMQMNEPVSSLFFGVLIKADELIGKELDRVRTDFSKMPFSEMEETE